MKLTPYRQVAKKALMSWNGLSEEEATNIVTTQSFEELESQCYAAGSMTYAVNSIADILGLPDRWKEDFLNTVLAKDHVFTDEHDNEELSKVARIWPDRVMNDNYEIVKVLAGVHDGWVKDNAKKFNKEGRENKRYQHLPVELIGWKETKADLLFVEPILSAIGVELNEEKLEKRYNKEVSIFFYNMDINNTDELIDYILNIKKLYRPVTEENIAKDEKIATEMANQVIDRMPQKCKEDLETKEN